MAHEGSHLSFLQAGVRQFQAELREICIHEAKTADGHTGVTRCLSWVVSSAHTHVVCQALRCTPKPNTALRFRVSTDQTSGETSQATYSRQVISKPGVRQACRPGRPHHFLNACPTPGSDSTQHLRMTGIVTLLSGGRTTRLRDTLGRRAPKLCARFPTARGSP